MLKFQLGMIGVTNTMQKWPERSILIAKLDGRVGARIHSTCLAINKTICLPDYCTVFKAEICPIREAISRRDSDTNECMPMLGPRSQGHSN